MARPSSHLAPTLFATARTAAVVAALAVTAPAGLAAQGKEVVERHEEGGTVHRRYQVDEQGRKAGEFLEYARDGTLLIRATYQADKLEGSYHAFHDNGKRKLKTRYRDGQLAGPYTAFRRDGTRHTSAHYYKDKLHGRFEQIYPNRKVKVRTRYRHGALHGKYESYFEDGKAHILATYDQGRRHGEYSEYDATHTRILTAVFDHEVRDGPYKLVQDGKVVIDQVWQQGRIARIRGVVPYPRPLAAVHGEIRRLLAAPKLEKGQEDSTAAQALRRLKAYRYLCGVPYRSLQLDARMCQFAKAAAGLCKRIGRLDHKPDRPEGMSRENYEIAYTGTSRCNLHKGSTLVGSVDAYMHDNGDENLKRVGHRRWCLNPGMARTGFGNDDLYCAMWAHDSSGPKVKSGMIHYPPPGYVPRDFFGAGYPWSVMFMDHRRLDKERVKVDIHVLRDDYTRSGEKVAIGTVNVHSQKGYPGSVLIFKTMQLRTAPGSRYFVEISLDGGRSLVTSYLVEFAKPAG